MGLSPRTQKAITTSLAGVMGTISAVCLLALLMLASATMGGCSTVSGFSQFVGGIARDIGDAAEGTRDHMAKNGPHR